MHCYTVWKILFHAYDFKDFWAFQAAKHCYDDFPSVNIFQISARRGGWNSFEKYCEDIFLKFGDNIMEIG